jgi:Ca2+-binding EF-hand superfamily protein
MTARQSQEIVEFFKWLDTKGQGGLDDVQFRAFLSCSVIDMSRRQMDKIFDMFDLDRSGSVEFGEVSDG